MTDEDRRIPTLGVATPFPAHQIAGPYTHGEDTASLFTELWNAMPPLEKVEWIEKYLQNRR